MLEREDIQEAIHVLAIYEEAFYPNKEAVLDIYNGLYWDEEKQCFSADLGLLLRGECENVQIFRNWEWVSQPFEERNRFFTTVVDEEGRIYFIKTVE